MPNRYRPALRLMEFVEDRPPGEWVARWVGTELVAELPGGRIRVKFNLLRLSAN